jgi:hypothetical protein
VASDTISGKPLSPFDLRPEIEVPMLVTATVVWVFPALYDDELLPGQCAPCDPEDVNAFDRTVIGFDSDGARIASHVGAVGLPVLGGIASFVDAAQLGWPARTSGPTSSQALPRAPD